MQNSTPNFQVAPQFDKMMWPFVKCKQMGGSGGYRISAEVTDSSRSKSSSIWQITQSRTFYPEWTSLRKYEFMPSCHWKHFGFILTSCGTTNLGSFGGGWNCACPPLSWEAVQGGGKAASELLSSPPWSGHSVCGWNPQGLCVVKECEFILKCKSNSKASLEGRQSI